MKTRLIITKQKRNYIAPTLEQIILDNEISLALESTPPTFESKNSIHAPEYFTNEPFSNSYKA